jgi:phosphoglycolate phosphatase
MSRTCATPASWAGVRAITFDLDGTLIHTLPDLAAAGNRMLQVVGRLPVTEDTVRLFIGDGIERLTKRLLTGQMNAEPSAEEFALAFDAFRRFYTEELVVRSRPFPGVVEGLATLQTHLPLACVTNKALAFTEPLLVATELWTYFDLVLAGDSLPRKKPDPLPFLHCAERLQVRPIELLVVGDSSNDCQAARAAGCPVVCVPYGYSGSNGVRELDCDAIVASVSDLASSLLSAIP